MTSNKIFLCVSIFMLLFTQSAHASEACTNPQQLERDEIFSLAALAMVHKDWQYSHEGRGHNIGSILVDENAKPVFWARNAVYALDDSSQHGEVRLIQNFLKCPAIGRYVSGYTVYTTLEPCAMCSGMLALTSIRRVVYVQMDPDYGHARNALKAIKYPRIYEECSPHHLKQKNDLESKFDQFKKVTGNENITDFLLSKAAYNIISSSWNSLKEYKVKYQENVLVLDNVNKFLLAVTNETYDEKTMERCPAID